MMITNNHHTRRNRVQQQRIVVNENDNNNNDNHTNSKSNSTTPTINIIINDIMIPMIHEEQIKGYLLETLTISYLRSMIGCCNKIPYGITYRIVYKIRHDLIHKFLDWCWCCYYCLRCHCYRC